ncbi:hypothetical protein HK405_012579, partial [Cladochytrium tenue]
VRAVPEARQYGVSESSLEYPGAGDEALRLLAETVDLIVRSSGDCDANHTRLDRGREGTEINEDEDDDDDDDEKLMATAWHLEVPGVNVPDTATQSAQRPGRPSIRSARLLRQAPHHYLYHPVGPLKATTAAPGRACRAAAAHVPQRIAYSPRNVDVLYVRRRDSDVAAMADTGGGDQQTVLTLRTELDVWRTGSGAAVHAWRLRGKDEDVVADWLVHVEAVVDPGWYGVVAESSSMAAAGGERRRIPVVSPVHSSSSASPQPTSRSPPPKTAGTPPAGFFSNWPRAG